MGVVGVQIISGAWIDTLSAFIKATQHELLLMSPWITENVARLIGHDLSLSGPLSFQVLARCDESDFLSGASHIACFRATTYPSGIKLAVRALPMLHAKMLVSDRQRVIIGSANMTDGGIYRNHEICVMFESKQIGADCTKVFFESWEIASPLPANYLDQIEESMVALLPMGEQEESEPRRNRSQGSRKRNSRAFTFRYSRPIGAKAAIEHLAHIRAQILPSIHPVEDVSTAMAWLTRTLKFVPKSDRYSQTTQQHVEALMCHNDPGIRATACDRAGRSGNRHFLPRLAVIATNPTEAIPVRSAATFALGILGSPEAFPVLGGLLEEKGDVGRWSRRGCFLLLNLIDHESQEWLLKVLHVNDVQNTLTWSKKHDVAAGTIAERLTKALILEQVFCSKWKEQDITALTAVMILASKALARQKRALNLLLVSKQAAEGLSVQPGDLRHGPLSASLLQRLDANDFLDPGLKGLLFEKWNALEGTTAIDLLNQSGKFGDFLKQINN
ncbi:MAG TPA: phospholipase D-like domain-containing protein [Candidatus Hydrogenedentes bacterium]|nr:phospholipase D-like domain-containing protein [Candidatus Hydrogenedentota bacterium]